MPNPKPGKLAPSRNSRLAWILCSLVCIVSLVYFAITLISYRASHDLVQLFNDLGVSALPLVFSIVAALIISRQPHNRIGWLLMGPAIFFIVVAPIDTYTQGLKSLPPLTFPVLLMFWLQGWSWLVAVFPLLLILLLFPTGRPPSPRWRWVLFYALGMFVFFILWATFDQSLMVNDALMVPNPIGLIPDTFIYTYIMTPWDMSLALLTVVCAASLFVRYRRAPSDERAQIRWLLFVAGIFVLIYLVLGQWSNATGQFKAVVDMLFIFAIMLFPIAIAIAILRYRLWDIDVIIRKTLIYALLTALLALVFFGSVVFLQQVFTRIVGTPDSPIVIVLSTLAIAALFTPLRRLIQNMLDRRFFRRNYNAERFLERFAAATRNEVEIEQLTTHLTSVVEETLQPQTVSLWLVSGKKL